MQLNLFCEGVDSINGYQVKLLKKVEEIVHFDKCVCTVKSHDGKDIFDSDKYVPIEYDICERNRYSQYYDMNSLLPLSESILEQMRPYESTALQLLIRNMDQAIYTFDESKELYLQHLRFWNHIFLSNKINYVIQVCLPHHCHDYIIYALAHIYNCGIMTNEASSIVNRYFVIQDIYKCPEKLLADYKKYLQMPEVKLADDIEKYYQALLQKNRTQEVKFLSGGKSKKNHARNLKRIYHQYFTIHSIIKRNKTYIKNTLLHPQNLMENMGMIKSDIDFCRRAGIKKHQMKSIKYYNKLTTQPDYEEKYIVFFLHYQPEATTLPQAGVFVEQELVLDILASSAQKSGVKLYVKEHYVQPYRRKRFYDRIASIPNVFLINSDVDSNILFSHSIAAATCNGTVIQESIFNDKPVLTFGNGAFNYAPGVFQCGSVEDTTHAIENILSGNAKFDQHEVRAYLRAFEDSSVYTNIYISDTERKTVLENEESLTNLVNCISKRILADQVQFNPQSQLMEKPVDEKSIND